MRARWLLPLLALAAASCPDFGLDSRRFACANQADCGPGWMCIGGFCEPTPDAAGGEICDNAVDDDGDLLADCRDPDCGEASCDDQNECTIDSCELDGRCARTNVIDDTPCGTGCGCLAGEPTERACGNGDDDDGDGLIDCDDPDCPGTPSCM